MSLVATKNPITDILRLDPSAQTSFDLYLKKKKNEISTPSISKTSIFFNSVRKVSSSHPYARVGNVIFDGAVLATTFAGFDYVKGLFSDDAKSPEIPTSRVADPTTQSLIDNNKVITANLEKTSKNLDKINTALQK